MSLEYTIARPYAKAAFEYAFEKAQLLEWSAMLECAALTIEDEAVSRLLKDPRVSEQQVLALIYSIGDKLYSDDFKNFLQVLSKNKRLPFVPYLYKHYEKLRSEAEKIVNVELISAFPL